MDTTTGAASAARLLDRLDRSGRIAVGGAATIAVGVTIGMILGAWDVQPFAVVMLVLALVAGVAVAAPAGSLGAPIEPHRPLVARVAAVVAVTLASLAMVEMLGDLDDLAEVGGILGLAVAVLVVGGAIALVLGTGPAAAARATDRGARLAGVGVGLVVGAWLLHLTVGFWALGPAVWALSAITLAAAVMVLGLTEGRASAWVGWLATGLAAFAALIALGQWSELMRLGETRLELGPGEILPFLVYATGIGLVISGGVIRAIGGRLMLPTTDAVPMAGDGIRP
jgi:hypothetical protein